MKRGLDVHEALRAAQLRYPCWSAGKNRVGIEGSRSPDDQKSEKVLFLMSRLPTSG